MYQYYLPQDFVTMCKLSFQFHANDRWPKHLLLIWIDIMSFLLFCWANLCALSTGGETLSRDREPKISAAFTASSTNTERLCFIIMSPGSERELYADKGSVVCFKLIFSDGFFVVVVFFNQSPGKGWDSWYSAFWAGMTVRHIWREKLLPLTKERAQIECHLRRSCHVENIWHPFQHHSPPNPTPLDLLVFFPPVIK